MNILDSALHREERAIFDLRVLYEQYGYKKYNMSKFEEYDLYLENKSFLPSQQIITFTDLSGRLMALKPDVTLSIAKNVPVRPKEPVKVYYNENVYRTPRGSNEFREIVQVGLEHLGQLDLYGQSEVVLLAYRSLERLSDNFAMVMSDLGFISGLFESCGLHHMLEEKILSCVGQKNAHEIIRFCNEAGVEAESRDAIAALTKLYGSFDETLAQAEKLVRNDKMQKSLCRLRELHEVLVSETDEDCLRLDFSVINDLSYYNGLIFQGFIDGVPNAIVSGGRYDNLMEKLGKKANAIGFAVYIDQLRQSAEDEDNYDVDILLLYDKGADAVKLSEAVNMLTAKGQRVCVQTLVPRKMRFRQILKFSERGLEDLESND